MEISTTRLTDHKEKVNVLIVHIGEDRYSLKETNDGRLQINKVSDNGNHSMRIYPRSGNEIELR